MKLNEIRQPNQFLTGRVDIENWLHLQSIKNFTIDSNGVVDVNDNVLIQSRMRSLPIQFGTVTGNFYCEEVDLYTLKGAPHTVGKVFSCSYNLNLRSLEYAPSNTESFHSYSTDIISLHNIHKTVKSISRKFIGNHEISSSVLGLLLIKNLDEVDINYEVDHILNKYLADSRDIHACQEELIQAGFAEHAKL